VAVDRGAEVAIPISPATLIANPKLFKVLKNASCLKEAGLASQTQRQPRNLSGESMSTVKFWQYKNKDALFAILLETSPTCLDKGNHVNHPSTDHENR